HSNRRHTDEPEKLTKLANINADHVALFAYFLNKLSATPDGDGSLLDRSTYMTGSGLGNPSVHNHTNLPCVVAGGHKGGRHIKYAQPMSLANVHLTLLEKAGIRKDNFSNSTGRIGELL